MIEFFKNRSYAIALGAGAAWLHGGFDWKVVVFLFVIVVLVNWRSA